MLIPLFPSLVNLHRSGESVVLFSTAMHTLYGDEAAVLLVASIVAGGNGYA
jgi:hypothetical protein